ncbi:MAG: hypothetical protein IPL08_06070 [Saprospiraceae bacterium]|nr:hypothetical protein [Saprospiraceae bacterium]
MAVHGGTSATSSTTPGCYTIKTRYVTAATCGTIIAGTTAPAACRKCCQQCSNLPCGSCNNHAG